MTLGVHFNRLAINTHRNLSVADRQLNVTLQRLSSGVRLQRAGDDPSSLMLANSMRHHLRGLAAASQNAEEGVSMLQTADGALDQVSSLLIRLKTIMVQAGNEGALDPSSNQALQDEANGIVDSISRISGETRFASLSLLDGTAGGTVLDDAAEDVLAGIDFSASALPGGIQKGSAISVTMPVGGLSMTRDRVAVSLSTTGGAMTPASSTDLVANLFQDPTGANSALSGVPATLSFTGPRGVAQTVTVTGTTTVGDVVAQINATSTATGVRAALTNGVLTVESTTFGPGTLTFSSTPMDGGTVGLLDSDTAAGNSYATAGTTGTLTLNYKDLLGIARTMTLTQDLTSAKGLTFRNTAGGPEAAPPYTAFDIPAFSVTLKDSTDGTLGTTLTASDAQAYTATRQSATHIHTGAMTDQRIELDIPDMRSNAIGFTAGLAASGFASVQSITTLSAITLGRTQEALQVIDAAINEVTSVRGRLGALQADGVEAALSNLQVASENLTASESRLRDADFALESANFAKQQIIYQAATAMLAQANQIPQTVVDLLKGR